MAAPRHCKAGVANHGPLLGWAIQKGHKVKWSDTKQTWMPVMDGCSEDGIGNEMGAQLAWAQVQQHGAHAQHAVFSDMWSIVA